MSAQLDSDQTITVQRFRRVDRMNQFRIGNPIHSLVSILGTPAHRMMVCRNNSIPSLLPSSKTARRRSLLNDASHDPPHRPMRSGLIVYPDMVANSPTSIIQVCLMMPLTTEQSPHNSIMDHTSPLFHRHFDSSAWHSNLSVVAMWLALSLAEVFHVCLYMPRLMH